MTPLGLRFCDAASPLRFLRRFTTPLPCVHFWCVEKTPAPLRTMRAAHFCARFLHGSCLARQKLFHQRARTRHCFPRAAACVPAKHCARCRARTRTATRAYLLPPPSTSGASAAGGRTGRRAEDGRKSFTTERREAGRLRAHALLPSAAPRTHFCDAARGMRNALLTLRAGALPAACLPHTTALGLCGMAHASLSSLSISPLSLSFCCHLCGRDNF